MQTAVVLSEHPAAMLVVYPNVFPTKVFAIPSNVRLTATVAPVKLALVEPASRSLSSPPVHSARNARATLTVAQASAPITPMASTAPCLVWLKTSVPQATPAKL